MGELREARGPARECGLAQAQVERTFSWRRFLGRWKPRKPRLSSGQRRPPCSTGFPTQCRSNSGGFCLLFLCVSLTSLSWPRRTQDRGCCCLNGPRRPGRSSGHITRRVKACWCKKKCHLLGAVTLLEGNISEMYVVWSKFILTADQSHKRVTLTNSSNKSLLKPLFIRKKELNLPVHAAPS